MVTPGWKCQMLTKEHAVSLKMFIPRILHKVLQILIYILNKRMCTLAAELRFVKWRRNSIANNIHFFYQIKNKTLSEGVMMIQCLERKIITYHEYLYHYLFDSKTKKSNKQQQKTNKQYSLSQQFWHVFLLCKFANLQIKIMSI